MSGAVIDMPRSLGELLLLYRSPLLTRLVLAIRRQRVSEAVPVLEGS